MRGQVLEWLNTNSAAVQACSTVALLVVTAVYVLFTKTLADEARRSQRPYVFVDVDVQDGRHVMLVVGNAGERAASAISIEVPDLQVPTWTRSRSVRWHPCVMALHTWHPAGRTDGRHEICLELRTFSTRGLG